MVRLLPCTKPMHLHLRTTMRAGPASFWPIQDRRPRGRQHAALPPLFPGRVGGQDKQGRPHACRSRSSVGGRGAEGGGQEGRRMRMMSAPCSVIVIIIIIIIILIIITTTTMYPVQSPVFDISIRNIPRLCFRLKPTIPTSYIFNLHEYLSG